MPNDYIDIRRNTEDALYEKVNSKIVLRRGPLRKQKDFKIRSSKSEYTFLQFHYAIWKWALANHNLTNRELGILLYVYPLIVFNSREFNQALKELESYDNSTLHTLMTKGWINVWATNGKSKTYTLSPKANTLVTRLHRMYMSEEPIPTSPRRNYLLKEGVDSGLLKLFTKFNKIIKDKNEKKQRRGAKNSTKRL